MNRRTVLKSAAAVAGAAAMSTPALPQATSGGGRLKQSVCYWTYQKWYPNLDDFCKEAARIGLKGIDLVSPEQFYSPTSLDSLR